MRRLLIVPRERCDRRSFSFSLEPNSEQGWIVRIAEKHRATCVYRYALRVEAYVGFLTDRYPPFSLDA
jgi:hypothetical protein